MCISHLAKHKSLKWEAHIEYELRRKQRFYRIANLFTDVPHLKNRQNAGRISTFAQNDSV